MPLEESFPLELNAVTPTQVTDPDNDSMVLSSASLGSINHLHEIRHEVQSLAKMAKELGRLVDDKGHGAAWSSASVFMPILADNSWTLRADGVSASFWFLIAAVEDEDSDEEVEADDEEEEERDRGDERWSTLSQTFASSGSNYVVDYTGETNGRDKREERRTRSNVHLFSVGTKANLIEFWAHPSAAVITVRVTQCGASTVKCLASKALDLQVPCGQWNHLAVNCREQVASAAQPTTSDDGCLQRTVHITAILNGAASASLQFHVALAPLKRAGANSFLLAGTARPATWSTWKPPAWYLGHITLYKGPILTTEKAVLLLALGADSVFVASCLEHQPSPNWPRCLRPQLVSRLIDWQQVFQVIHSNSGFMEIHFHSIWIYIHTRPWIVDVFLLFKNFLRFLDCVSLSMNNCMHEKAAFREDVR